MNYNDVISIENLFQAWSDFRKGKSKRKDVQIFERNLEDNLFGLYEQLKNRTYRHGSYESFYIHDPKQRHIHKANVCDRVVHHLLYKYLYELFDKTFIHDSYSCRLKKGTHKAVSQLEKFTKEVSKNYTRPCWILKLDIRKFFASVDHKIIVELLAKRVEDKDILWLLTEVIESFCLEEGKGIPLGNLTSQIFANIYLNKLDKFIKHDLREGCYSRYCDDFAILSSNRDYLIQRINPLKQFIADELKLELHPKKIILRKLTTGIDFLGYVVLPYYRVPRAKTKRRIFKRLERKFSEQSLQSYLGYLGHASSFKLTQRLKNQVWFWQGQM